MKSLAKKITFSQLVEFGLLIIAITIIFLSWELVEIGVKESSNIAGSNPLTLISLLLIIVVFATHLGIRKIAPHADPLIFPIAVLLNGLGVVMIHRIDYALIENEQIAQAKNQLILSLAGLMLMLLTLGTLKNHQRLRNYTYTSLLVGLFLLALPTFPIIGKAINGARLWISVAGFTFQPAEISKICFVVFFAGYLVVQRDNLALAGKKVLGIQLPQIRHFAPIFIAWTTGLLILAMEKDFGTALLFFGIFVAMLYVATERISWIIMGGILSSLSALIIIHLMPHIQSRFTTWLHAFDNEVYDSPYGSYQLVQGWFGMASGGLFGTGLGKGYPAKAYAANSDFIIASFGEEIGLVGLLAILCLYLLLIFRALKIGMLLPNGFGKLLATGFGFTIALQSFVVVGGVTRVIPLTGLAMPFLALGGSALLANWIIIGVLLRMSSDAKNAVITLATDKELLDTGDVFATETDEHPTEVVKL